MSYLCGGRIVGGSKTNQEQLDILKKGVDEWNAWRQENPRVKVDLRGIRLEGPKGQGSGDFAMLKMHSINLRGADLRGAWLACVTLEWADMRGVDLRGASIQECDFRGVSLRGADLSGLTHFWPHGNDFYHVDVTGVKYPDAWYEYGYANHRR